MAENCRSECPLYQFCQPHFRLVSAMTEASLTATAGVSPNFDQPASSESGFTVAVPTNDPNTVLYEDTATAEVAFINAQENCRGPRLSWAGRLIFALNVLGATSGVVPTQEDLTAINEMTQLIHPKCPNRKAQRAYRQVIGLNLLQRT